MPIWVLMFFQVGRNTKRSEHFLLLETKNLLSSWSISYLSWQQDVINTDRLLLSQHGWWFVSYVHIDGCVSEWVGSACVRVCGCVLFLDLFQDSWWFKVPVYSTWGQSLWCPKGSRFSLTDFPPTSSYSVLAFLPFIPSVCHIRMPTTFAHLTSSPKFLKLKKKEKQKGVKFSYCDTPSQGGKGNTHYPGKWFVSVSVRTEERVQPLLLLSISKSYNWTESSTLRLRDSQLSTVGG